MDNLLQAILYFAIRGGGSNDKEYSYPYKQFLWAHGKIVLKLVGWLKEGWEMKFKSEIGENCKWSAITKFDGWRMATSLLYTTRAYLLGLVSGISRPMKTLSGDNKAAWLPD